MVTAAGYAEINAFLARRSKTIDHGAGNGDCKLTDC